METSHAVDSSTLNPEDAQKNNDEDDEGDDQDVEHSKSSVAALNKDCCVKTTLVSLVVTTAILLVVIVASYRKPDVATVQPKITDTEDVFWLLSNTYRLLVFKHQFLLRDLSGLRPVQIVAVDDVRHVYVIMWPDVDKHFNLYMTVDFEKRSETFVVVSKSQNIYATNIEENRVLLCQTGRFDRGFRGSFASVSAIMASSELQIRHTKMAHAINYIEGPLILERFISTVVNSSCEDLQKIDIFKWNKPDESLACGEKVYSETDIESCSLDLCRTFPGIPLSKGQACHKFRSCNYFQRSCDPFYRQNPSKMDNHPYCVCRKTAAEDAKRLSCPLVRDDGGECEIPRRDLQVTQSNLPCLCLYKFYIAYPYLSQPDTSLHRQQENINEQRSSVLEWNVKEEIVTGPALTFSECPC